MMTNGLRRLASAAAVAATVAAAGLMAAAPARADTVPASTTCSNPYTGSQAGPSSFDVEILETGGTPGALLTLGMGRSALDVSVVSHGNLHSKHG